MITYGNRLITKDLAKNLLMQEFLVAKVLENETLPWYWLGAKDMFYLKFI